MVWNKVERHERVFIVTKRSCVYIHRNGKISSKALEKTEKATLLVWLREVCRRTSEVVRDQPRNRAEVYPGRCVGGDRLL